jgi:hypothetical protein
LISSIKDANRLGHSAFGGQFDYNHNWNPYWVSGFYGAAAAVRYDDFSKIALCGLTGNGAGGAFPPAGLMFGVDGVLD